MASANVLATLSWTVRQTAGVLITSADNLTRIQFDWVMTSGLILKIVTHRVTQSSGGRVYDNEISVVRSPRVVCGSMEIDGFLHWNLRHGVLSFLATENSSFNLGIPVVILFALPAR